MLPFCAPQITLVFVDIDLRCSLTPQKLLKLSVVPKFDKIVSPSLCIELDSLLVVYEKTLYTARACTEEAYTSNRISCYASSLTNHCFVVSRQQSIPVQVLRGFII